MIGGASAGHATSVGLGSHDQRCGARALILSSSSFCDAAALSWALPCTGGGLPQVWPAHAAVTHGNEFTRCRCFLYTLIPSGQCMMPFIYGGMSSWIYLAAAVLFSLGFLRVCVRAVAQLFDRALACKTFRFPHPPERAVCGTAGGLLRCDDFHAETKCLHLIAAGALSVCATGLLGACSEKAEFRGGRHRRWNTPATFPDRPQRPTPPHQGLCRQGGRGVLWLTPSAPTCAPPRCRNWPRSSRCWQGR